MPAARPGRSGHFDAAALREAGADRVIETLEQPLPLD
jgi:hypothetical protein